MAEIIGPTNSTTNEQDGYTILPQDCQSYSWSVEQGAEIVYGLNNPAAVVQWTQPGIYHLRADFTNPQGLADSVVIVVDVVVQGPPKKHHND